MMYKKTSIDFNKFQADSALLTPNIDVPGIDTRPTVLFVPI